MRWWRGLCLILCLLTAVAAKQPKHGKEGNAAAAKAKVEQTAPQPEAPEPEVALPPLFKPPYEEVRRLEIIQDRITRGNREAHIFQRELIAQIADQFSKMPDGIWKQRRNARAAITYVLSGGDPFILQKLSKLADTGDVGGGVTPELVKGLIAYSRGRNTDALEQLVKVDASTLGTGAGGHLALVQATLFADKPAKALVYLDQVRLLSPGTLVEEAALRRTVDMAAKLNNADKFMAATSQYLRHYNKSVYALNFLTTFATSFADSDMGENADVRARLEKTLSELSDDRRKIAYLALAEQGILFGHIELAKMATRKALELVKGDPDLTLHVELLAAATGIVTDDYDQSLATLKSIDPQKLNSRDRDLLNAALALAKKLREPPTVDVADLPSASAAQGNAEIMKDMPPAVIAGQKAIALADKLLHGAGK